MRTAPVSVCHFASGVLPSAAGFRIAAAACIAAAGACCAQPVPLDKARGFEGMRERWAGEMDRFNVPGMAIAIVKDGRVLAIETFGVRAPARDGEPAPPPTPDTMFYIGSITKNLTATAIAALADDGKLSLDDPVIKHLPRFALADGSASTITIRDLMCHKPGIGSQGPVVTLEAYTGEITEDRFYRWLPMLRPRGQPGYANVHFTLLGRVVEAASGTPWKEFIDERLLKPAGMTRTTAYASRMYADPDHATPMERANGVDGDWRASRLQKTDRTMHAAGGHGMSAGDAARWIILHVNGGEIDGRRVVSAERIREMQGVHAPLSERQGTLRIIEGYGLGWESVGTFHGTALCSHSGGYSGADAYIAILPEKRAGLAILMNASGATRLLQDAIAIDILDRLFDGDERVDVLEAYRKRLEDNRATAAERYAARRAALSRPLQLTRPVSAYAGRYQNGDLGTLTIAQDAASPGRLNVMMGDCELEIVPAGPDAFKVVGPTIQGVVFTFVSTPGGEVTAIGLEVPGEGRLLFTR